MKRRTFILYTAAGLLSACTGRANRTSVRSGRIRVVRITHVPQQEGGRELMLHAMSLVGTPYRWGGSSGSGFDCSGMVQYVYRNALNVGLPRTSREMAAAGRRIAPSELQTGDLVFFNTSGKGISHVGLYLGKGEFLHAPRAGSSVKTERLDHPYYAKRFVKAATFFPQK